MKRLKIILAPLAILLLMLSTFASSTLAADPWVEDPPRKGQTDGGGNDSGPKGDGPPETNNMPIDEPGASLDKPGGWIGSLSFEVALYIYETGWFVGDVNKNAAGKEADRR